MGKYILQDNLMHILWLSPYDMFPEWVISSMDHFMPEHDKTVYWWNANPDKKITTVIRECNPDIILYISAAGGNIPKPWELAIANSVAPVIMLCFDGSHPDYWSFFSEYRDKNCVTSIVNMDGNHDWPSTANDLTLAPPVDPRYYEGGKRIRERSIRLGTSMTYPDGYRRQVVNFLKKHAGLVIKQRETNFGSYASYARFMNECKIVLNVALNSTAGKTVLKARILETGFAGACLLEQSGSYTSKWLDEGKDYVSYDTPEHAAEIVNTISDEEIDIFASNLRRKIVSEHHPKVFWGKVFERAKNV
jgi:hypothetical protein